MHKLFFDTALMPDGWHRDVVVSVAEGTITAVETEVGLDARRQAEPLAGVAVPGVGNLHSHTFQRGIAGLTERRGAGEDHFWTWREEMYRLSSALGPDDVEAIAGMAFVEMLESGFTSVAEFHYLHHRPDGRPYDNPAELSARVAAAAGASGIGLTLLPVFYAQGGFGGAPPGPGQRRFVCDLALYGRIVEGARRAVEGLSGGAAGIAPHSLRAVTAVQLSRLAEAFPHGPVHIHIAEQMREVDDCRAALGARPVDWLLDHAAVDRRWCLVHATHMTAGETKRLAASGAVAGLCPVTESDLGDGIFPAVDFAAGGGRYGVGSDSNVRIGLADELRTLEYSQRLRDRARNRLAEPGGSVGRHLLDQAVTAGAQALGRDHAGLAPGARADVVVLDPAHPCLYGRQGDALLDSWIFAASASPVRDVVAAGVHLVRGGRHMHRDAIAATFRHCIDRLASRI